MNECVSVFVFFSALSDTSVLLWYSSDLLQLLRRSRNSIMLQDQHTSLFTMATRLTLSNAISCIGVEIGRPKMQESFTQPNIEAKGERKPERKREQFIYII